MARGLSQAMATSTSASDSVGSQALTYLLFLVFKLRFGPRGVLRCTATTVETPGEDPRFGKWGKQNCTDTGPLDKKRMETVDDEILANLQAAGARRVLHDEAVGQRVELDGAAAAVAGAAAKQRVIDFAHDLALQRQIAGDHKQRGI